jgi:hypothetical protein
MEANEVEGGFHFIIPFFWIVNGLSFLFSLYPFKSWVAPPCGYGKIMEKGWK